MNGICQHGAAGRHLVHRRPSGIVLVTTRTPSVCNRLLWRTVSDTSRNLLKRSFSTISTFSTVFNSFNSFSNFAICFRQIDHHCETGAPGQKSETWILLFEWRHPRTFRWFIGRSRGVKDEIYGKLQYFQQFNSFNSFETVENC